MRIKIFIFLMILGLTGLIAMLEPFALERNTYVYVVIFVSTLALVTGLVKFINIFFEASPAGSIKGKVGKILAVVIPTLFVLIILSLYWFVGLLLGAHT